MSTWERTSMELPRALSGSKELMACPGVASTWTVAIGGSAAVAFDWAVKVAVHTTKERIVIARADRLSRPPPPDIRPKFFIAFSACSWYTDNLRLINNHLHAASLRAPLISLRRRSNSFQERCAAS